MVTDVKLDSTVMLLDRTLLFRESLILKNIILHDIELLS